MGRGWGTALATALPSALRSVVELQNMALQREQFESEKELMPLKMRSQKALAEEAEIETQKSKYELKKLLEEEEWGKKPFNMTLTREYMASPPEVQNDMLEWGQEMGYWDEKGMGMKKYGLKAKSEIENNPQLLYRFGYPIILAREDELRTLMQQQTEMQNQGVDMKTDKKAIQLQNLIGNKTKQYGHGLAVYQNQMNKLFGTTDKSLSDIELFMKDPEKFEEYTKIKEGGKTENLSQDIDTFGVTKVGSAYNTPEGKKQVMDYIATPDGKKDFDAFRREQKQNITIKTGEPRADARFAMNLRKEFNALQPIKDYRDVTTKYNVMVEAFKESKKTKNYVAVDQALITLYNKMTDPQSVVRESEYIRTPQDMAIMDRMESAMIRVAKGGRLESDTRQAIMTMAGKFKKAYESKYNEIANEYRGYANSSGINPNDVVKEIKEERQSIRNISKAVNYLKSAKDRNDAKNKMKALMSASDKEGKWTEEELREIERQAGY